MAAVVVAGAWAAVGGSGTGPYATVHSTHEYAAMDPTSHKIDVVQPTPKTAGQRFPLIAFNHGFQVRPQRRDRR